MGLLCHLNQAVCRRNNSYQNPKPKYKQIYIQHHGKNNLDISCYSSKLHRCERSQKRQMRLQNVFFRPGTETEGNSTERSRESSNWTTANVRPAKTSEVDADKKPCLL